MAPEVVHKGASSNSDIWALGATIIEMLTGNPPFFNMNPHQALLFGVLGGNSPELPPNITPVCFLFFP